MKPLSSLAKELRKIRIDHDLTRPEMAKDLKISDRDLANIESGKTEVGLEFLGTVADKYAVKGAVSDLLETLTTAFINSVANVNFNMSELNPDQRAKVIFLRNEIAEENAVAIAAAEAERKRIREEKAAARKATPAKATKPAPVQTVTTEEQAIAAKPEPKKEVIKVVPGGGDDLDDLDDLEEPVVVAKSKPKQAVKAAPVEDDDDLDSLDGLDLTDDELDILSAA